MNRIVILWKVAGETKRQVMNDGEITRWRGELSCVSR